MGCGMPAAVGAAMANTGRICLAVCGDGGFAMTSQVSGFASGQGTGRMESEWKGE